MTFLVPRMIQNNYFNHWAHLLDSCLLHYSCHLIAQKYYFLQCHHSIKRSSTSPLQCYAKGHIARFDSAKRVLLSDIGSCFNLGFITDVAVVFIFIFFSFIFRNYLYAGSSKITRDTKTIISQMLYDYQTYQVGGFTWVLEGFPTI